MMIAPILAVAHPHPPETINLKMVAPASEVVRAIAERQGRKSSYARSLADHVLIVDLKNVDPAEALNRIAWVVYGEASVEGDTVTLRVDGEAVNRGRAAFQKSQLARNRELSRRCRDMTDPKSPTYQKDLGSRLLAHFVAALNPEDWTTRDPFRNTWRLAPNPMQRQLPSSPLQTVREALAREPQPENGRPEPDDFFLGVSPVDVEDGVAFFGGPTRGGNLTLDGRTSFLTIDWPAPIPAELKTADLGEQPVSWSETTLAFMSELMSDEPNRANSALKDLRSGKVDPQWVGTADAYFALGDATKRSLVVDVPDSQSFPILMKSQAPLRDLLPVLSRHGMQVSEGWITARPVVPKPSSAWQTSRVGWRNLTRSINAENIDHLDVLADFLTLDGPLPHWNGLAPFMNLLLGDGTAVKFIDPSLNLWAHLPNNLRVRLAGGDSIPLSAVGADAQIALWSNLPPNEIRSPNGDPQSFPFATLSDRCPNGLQGAILTGETIQEPVVWADLLQGGSMAIPAGQYEPGSRLFTHVQPAWQTTIRLRVTWPNGQFWSGRVNRTAVPIGKRDSNLSTWPEAHRKAIAARGGGGE